MEPLNLSQETYRELSKKVHSFVSSSSWMQLHGYELGFLFLRLFGFILGFYFFSFLHFTSIVVGIILMSYCYSGAVITGTHESSHGSLFKSKKMNLIWGYFFSDFLVGQSSYWWHHKHVEVHHVETNIKNKDPPLLSYKWMNKYIYFFIIPYLIGFWFIYNSIYFLFKKPFKLLIYLLLMILGYILNIYLFMMVLPLYRAIVAMLVMRFLFAPIFLHIAIFNHVALDEPSQKYPWLKHQTITTRNLKNNWFIRGFGGNAFVDAHVDHHLFPTLSNHSLLNVKPIIQEVLHDEEYVYLEESYFDVLRHCFKEYDKYF